MVKRNEWNVSGGLVSGFTITKEADSESGEYFNIKVFDGAEMKVVTATFLKRDEIVKFRGALNTALK